MDLNMNRQKTIWYEYLYYSDRAIWTWNLCFSYITLKAILQDEKVLIIMGPCYAFVIAVEFIKKNTSFI
jgi:hypothetical protein